MLPAEQSHLQAECGVEGVTQTLALSAAHAVPSHTHRMAKFPCPNQSQKHAAKHNISAGLVVVYQSRPPWALHTLTNSSTSKRERGVLCCSMVAICHAHTRTHCESLADIPTKPCCNSPGPHQL